MNLQTIISQQFDKFKLDQLTFAQIIKVLNITVENPRDPNAMKTLQEKFKSQLLSIFQSQDRNYKDYLSLPKFFVLKQSTRDKIFSLFDQIWKQYSRQVEVENSQFRNQEIEKMIPEFKGINEIERFHLQMFNSFRSSKLCKQNREEYKQNSLPIAQTGIEKMPFQRNFNPPLYMMQQHPDFMNFHANNPNPFYQKVQDNFKFMNPTWSDRKQLAQDKSGPGCQDPFYERQNIGNFQKPQFISNPIKSFPPAQYDYQMSEPIEEQNKSYLTGSEDEFLSKVHQYMFSECACQGALKKTDEYFVCKQCKYHYHFQCLYLNKRPNEELCPCCKLKSGSNMFLIIHPEPYGKRWCTNLKAQKLSIMLTQKEFQKMRMERKNVKPNSQLEYQLRFLKITRNINGKKVPSQNSRKFNSIPLPGYFVQKMKPYNVFDVSLKKNDDNENSEECTYFFAVFIVEKISQLALTEELFSNLTPQYSVGEEFMQRYLGDQESITIKMKDPTSQQRILYPTRGDQCDHAQVFDCMSILQYYREHGQRLKDKLCSICDLPINKMIADRFLLQKINEYYEENEDRGFEFLKYIGQGQVQYLMEEEEQSGSGSEGSNPDNPDDSESLSS